MRYQPLTKTMIRKSFREGSLENAVFLLKQDNISFDMREKLEEHVATMKLYLQSDIPEGGENERSRTLHRSRKRM